MSGRTKNEALLGIGWDRVQYLDIKQRDEILGQKQLTRYGIFRPARMSMIVKKRKTWGYGDSGISRVYSFT